MTEWLNWTEEFFDFMRSNKQNKEWKRRNNSKYHRDTKKKKKEYHEQLYANNLDNLEEMENFLETNHQN